MQRTHIIIAAALQPQSPMQRILAFRPAPIQASYLGYPGMMGVPFIVGQLLMAAILYFASGGSDAED